MYKRFAVALAAVCLAAPAAAQAALPGDPGIQSPSFRLNTNTLEPGCFPGNRLVDLDTHIRLATLSTELHVTVDDGARWSVDQVLVPSRIDGYSVYNTFDTGTVNDDPDIDPGQTATGMFSPTLTIDTNQVIICVSDHGDALQNEPYEQQAGGLVSAKNRPILTPEVTAVGVSAITNLKTFKVGFGYKTTRWYQPTLFDGRGAFPDVTDPNGIGDPVFGDNLPDLVDIFPRQAGTYDARRVNDVESARALWTFPTVFDGQTFLFKRLGDDTAWSDTRTTPVGLFNLLATLTQGDLPLSWDVRASLASPQSERKVEFTDADYRAWNQSWQDYYKGGPKPTMALVPGTNSPDPDPSITVIVNPVLTQPPPTPSNPTPPAVPVTPQPVTVGGVTSGGANAIANAVNAKASCKSTRVIHFHWSKAVKRAAIKFRGHTVKAKMQNGRLRATADMRGYSGHPGSLMKVTTVARYKNGRVIAVQRLFKVC